MYYFKERERGNSSLKFIIITDFYRFFIFRASEFEELFYNNKFFKTLYKNFTDENLFKGNTSEFYAECEKILKNPNYENSIPKKDLFDTLALKGFYIELETLFSRAFSDKDFKVLKPIFKAFSPEFLLDTFNPNDANTLNKAFYNELLYILGLGEFKQNGKIIISVSEESKKGAFTLYNAILQKCKDKENFRAKSEEEQFESLMQLIILWLNRILFLKLIEASLVKFNDDTNLKFLNTQKVPNFSILSGLFFEILAKAHTQRDATHLQALYYLPYLNSSLFEKQEIEKTLLDIKDLENEDFEYFKATQIKDKHAKKKQGKIKLLSYLFEFLDSFDFGSDEEADEFVLQKNDLISSSVLGLVFEKLNGYKEGSFYTPSFITSYMCRQSLQKVVIDKFNGAKSWECKDINELKIKLDKLTDSSEGYKEANELFHSIKICDPAVGSGHFLVSALNELIFLKFDLGILCERDSEGHYHRLKDIRLKIVNDEIIITDSKNKAFSYTLPAHEDIESHRIQKALFETKKALIESCLFGVDINPNSCEITKLRLWIELLKHSYYKNIATKELETLPNIDINIKCGNSLISYFELNKSLSHYPNIKARMDRYKKAVNDYKEGFGDKALIYGEIKSLKESFKNFCFADKFQKELKAFNQKCEAYSKKYGNFLAIDDENLRLYVAGAFGFIEFDEKEATKAFKELKKDYESIFNLENNKPFEWRFEFPEVLDSNGNFLGFDLIIGNPPYIRQEEIKHLKPELKKHFSVYTGTSDIYTYFYELGFRLLRQEGILSLITSNKWCRAGYGEALRGFILKNTSLLAYIDFNGMKVFESATVDTSITSLLKATKKDNAFKYLAFTEANLKDCQENINKKDIAKNKDFTILKQNDLSTESFTFADPATLALKQKIEKIGTPLKDWDINIYRGILTGYNEAFIISSEKREEILESCKDEEERARTKELIKPILRGRDIKRYSYEWAGLWIINTHNGYTIENSACHCERSEATEAIHKFTPSDIDCHEPAEADSRNGKIKIPPIDINDYPSLKKHFDEVANSGKQSKGKGFYNRDDKGITPYNLRNCAYINEFAKPKISWQRVTQEPSFIIESDYCLLDSMAFLTHYSLEELHYILGFLNSKAIFYYFKNIGHLYADTGFLLSNQYVKRFPIPKISNISKQTHKKIIACVEKILENKKQNPTKDTKDLESKLDSMIYELYGLNQDEIALIEAEFAKGERERERERTEVINKIYQLLERFLAYQNIVEYDSISNSYQGKILYPCIMAKEPCFIYEEKGFFAPAPANLITGKEIEMKYLTGLLNSKGVYFFMREFYMGGGIEGELKTNNLLKLPIPKITAKNQKIADSIIALVEEILTNKAKDKNSTTLKLEKEIDDLVYKLYNLNDEEIKIIENKE